MTDFERDTERRITSLESNVNSLIAEMLDFKKEMRQQNQMRANELRDLQKRQDDERRRLEAAQAKRDAELKAEQTKRDAELKAAQRRHEDDMREINKKIDDKFDRLSDQLHTMTIAAVVGFGAIAAAVGGLVFAAFR